MDTPPSNLMELIPSIISTPNGWKSTKITSSRALTAEDKNDVVEVERVLLAGFSVDAYIAYELFTERKLCDGEKADVFLADLR